MNVCHRCDQPTEHGRYCSSCQKERQRLGDMVAVEQSWEELNNMTEKIVTKDLDENGYARIRKLEDGMTELRLIMTNIYRKMNEGSDTSASKTKEEKANIEDIKKKQLQELINNSKVGRS